MSNMYDDEDPGEKKVSLQDELLDALDACGSRSRTVQKLMERAVLELDRDEYDGVYVAVGLRRDFEDARDKEARRRSFWSNVMGWLATVFAISACVCMFLGIGYAYHLSDKRDKAPILEHGMAVGLSGQPDKPPEWVKGEHKEVWLRGWLRGDTQRQKNSEKKPE